jgi:hypothetical protein
LNAAGEDWQALVVLMDRVGPTLGDCVDRGEMGKPEVDVGWRSGANKVAPSLRVPQQFGIELVVSAYFPE